MISIRDKMDTVPDERDDRLLSGDRYTFFVLRRIMRGDCEILLTDHEDLILCYSCAPYPVWIWTPDNASDEVPENAYRLAKETALLDGKHSFNIKYELAEYFIQRAAEEGLQLHIATNMFAYDCPDPVAPQKAADGQIHLCTEQDFGALVEFIELFHREIGLDQKDTAGYAADARAYLDAGNMYFWKNEAGENAACCRFNPTGEMASINLVFTRPEYRRKHYAENLVYQVTMAAKEAGFLPMLYTDADYAASNACYEKIGYVLRGKLCTIS